MKEAALWAASSFQFVQSQYFAVSTTFTVRGAP